MNSDDLAGLAPLPRAFFARPAIEVAPDLLGKLVVRVQPLAVVRLVEVEAYLGPRDAASHARHGPQSRARVLFGPPGHLYVFLIYGLHACMNVSCEAEGTAGGVLLRAAEPVVGVDRSTTGPGNLCAALGVNVSHNGLDITGTNWLYLASDGVRPAVARSARIGVDYAGRWARRRLRFYVPRNPHVSRAR